MSRLRAYSLRIYRSTHPALGIIAVVVLGLSVASLALYFYIPKNTIVLRDDGFHPRTITVQPGQRVTFVNHSKEAFWPASNNHPQHDSYPEFDAGKPILKGQSWSFVFGRPGRWGFHDHLRSFYVGFINVGEGAANYDCTAILSTSNIGKKRDCWDEKLLEELHGHGATAAFKLFAQFYTSDPDFTVVGCHTIAHTLGDAAYGEYLQNGKKISTLQFPPESVYCGYGYYHGILEHMIRDNPDYTKAANFCDWLITNHEKDLPRIRLNCYHAIGHGFIPSPTNIEMWGDVHAATAPAIAACKQIPATDARKECYQGAFNVIGDWMANNEFGFRLSKENPLGMCATFADPEVSSGCYYEFSMRIIPFVHDDLIKLYAMYIASIKDDYIADTVMHSAAASVLGAHIAETNFMPYLEQCRALPERVRIGCLKGLSAAFVAHGEPEHEYVKAVAFCESPKLSSGEKDICYRNAIQMFKGIYTQEKVADVCTKIESPYNKYCVYE